MTFVIATLKAFAATSGPTHGTPFLSQIGAEEKCNAFYEVIKAATALIPQSEVPFTQKDKVWITPLIKSMINKRYDAYRRKDFKMYNHYKQKVKLLIEESKNKWLQSTKASTNGLWKIYRDALNLSKSATLSSLIRSFPSPTDAAEKSTKNSARISRHRPIGTHCLCH